MIMIMMIMMQRIVSSRDPEKPAVLVTCVFCLPQVAMIAKPNKRKNFNGFFSIAAETQRDSKPTKEFSDIVI